MRASRPAIGQRIDLRFDAPELSLDSERTVVLAATGYYPVHAEAMGAPQGELGNRILNEPGAFPDWSLRKLYRERDEMLAQWPSDFNLWNANTTAGASSKVPD